jgi:solute:Na+ symporter, SSS family
LSPALILTCVTLYSLLLFWVVWITSRKADNESYFVGNRSSKWYIVAYGMIGASLSGVTFISVPGNVYNTQLGYFQVVLGYLVGYWVIAMVLLPLYYRMQLTSIYTYLEERFGKVSYKTGSLFFILSRVVGASLRVFIVVGVLQSFVFDRMGVPFYVTVIIFLLLILAYTYKGGVKTIVWTDTLQTTFMLLSLVLTVILISGDLNFSLAEVWDKVWNGKYSTMIFGGENGTWKSGLFFPKQFFGGMFIAIAMTGLDQEMMQKNISCRNVGEAKKNMITFSFIVVIVNALFLVLGVLLYEYITQPGIMIPSTPEGKILTDTVFPTVALEYLGTVSGVLFVIGIISAVYPSADGALTALTACWCIDIVGMKRRGFSEAEQTRLRQKVHISFAVVLLVVIVLFREFSTDAVINNVLKFAGYTYGPLLGLYAFGLFTKMKVYDRLVPVVCIAAPLICVFLDLFSVPLFNGFKFGPELLIVNGALTFAGLVMLRRKA